MTANHTPDLSTPGEEDIRPDAPDPQDESQFGIRHHLSSLPSWVISSVLHATALVLFTSLTVSETIQGGTDPLNNSPILDVRDFRSFNNPTPRLPEPPDTRPNPEAEIAQFTLKEIKGDILDPKNPSLIAPDYFKIGDHNETNNPDLPDTHTASGRPEAIMMSLLPPGGVGLGLGKGEGAGDGTGKTVDEASGLGALIGFGSAGSGGGGDGRLAGPWGPRSTTGGRQNMVTRGRGRKETIGWTDAALAWLAAHQEKDGHWDRKAHEATSTYPTSKDNIGVTGLATLAFLGAGNTEKHGFFKENVRRGVQWLVSEQDAKGLWGSNASEQWNSFMYDNAIGLMALAEAYGMGRNKQLKDAAQKTVDALAAAQTPYGGWAYSPSGGDPKHVNDTSVTIWCAMAMKSAKMADLKVPGQVFTGCLNWVDAAQDLSDSTKAGGSMGYDYKGGRMAYRGKIGDSQANMSKGHLQKLNLLTAGAGLIRVFWGQPTSHPGVTGPCNILLEESLPGQAQAESYYALYYQTFLMFQKGGPSWNTWCPAMQKFLESKQRKDGTVEQFKGSYDPIKDDEPTAYGGRVMATALGALTNEVFYRFLQINSDKPGR